MRALACRRHRAALVAFVDRREEGAGTPPALLHLDRCDRCRSELESIALTIIALHRLAGELDHLAPSTARAPRVVGRGRPRLPGLALAGPLLATALAVVLLFPALGLRGQVAPQPAIAPAPAPAAHSRQLSVEYLPAEGPGSAKFWTYGTYGLTAQVLWPPSGPSRLPLDPERARFDLRAAGRVPGAWSSSSEQIESALVDPHAEPGAGASNAESI
jgi:hypothetical protein